MPPESQRLDTPDEAHRTPQTKSIHVELRGLPGAAGSDPIDVYCPEVHRPNFVKANNVNRLDVISCWKGLSYNQASEIALWKRLLGDALGGQLDEAVRAIFPAGMITPSLVHGLVPMG